MDWIKRFVSEFDWWTFASTLTGAAIGGFIGLTIALHNTIWGW